MANPPLIAWAEVPEGHYVWFRRIGATGPLKLGVCRHDSLFSIDETTGETTLRDDELMEFAVAEQGPGELAAMEANRNEAVDRWQVENEARRDAEEELAAAKSDLTRLRAATDPSGTISPDSLVNLAALYRRDSDDADEREERYERLRDGLAALEQERAKLIAFVLEILKGYNGGEVGDIDGGWLEDFALEHGFLEAKPESADDPLYYVAEWLKVDRLAALREGQ